eukprot:3645281-Pyramimonas_sp.AAC.1
MGSDRAVRFACEVLGSFCAHAPPTPEHTGGVHLLWCSGGLSVSRAVSPEASDQLESLTLGRYKGEGGTEGE